MSAPAVITTTATATANGGVAVNEKGGTSSPVAGASHDETSLTIPEGHVGNLTLDEQRKLQQFWSRILDICGKRPATPAATNGDAASSPRASTNKRPASILSQSTGRDAANDKYGQTDEFIKYLETADPASIHATLWSSIKNDHPDSSMLRFLRARKWEVDKAVVMLIATVKWRQDMSIDDAIVRVGEAVALKSQPTRTADDEGFMLQYRSGKSYVRNLDKEGRPVYIVKPRLHNPKQQSAKVMENYVLHTIESIRVLIKDPFDTACLIFDLGGFGLRNMDFPAVQFIVQVFEARYPEMLGVVLVHNAPWVFHGIWRIVKGWLDPVVASKIHFTKSNADLQAFIPRENLQTEYGGVDKWEYAYSEPKPGENDMLADAESRAKIEAERVDLIAAFEKNTVDCGTLEDDKSDEAQRLIAERGRLADALQASYWRLDPYVRSRTFYDRVGILNDKGEVNFAPNKE